MLMLKHYSIWLQSSEHFAAYTVTWVSKADYRGPSSEVRRPRFSLSNKSIDLLAHAWGARPLGPRREVQLIAVFCGNLIDLMAFL
jgi:hypothetical protein